MEVAAQPTNLWPPPEDFTPVPSQVAGIELYAPTPEEEVEETRTSSSVVIAAAPSPTAPRSGG